MSILSGSFIFDFFDEVLKTFFFSKLDRKVLKNQIEGNDSWSTFLHPEVNRVRSFADCWSRLSHESQSRWVRIPAFSQVKILSPPETGLGSRNF